MTGNKQKVRLDNPYSTFNFIVKIEGFSGGFSEVSGLTADIEVYPFKEGGMNFFEHKLFKNTKYSDITLKRGITDEILYKWYLNTIYGDISRKNGSIVLRDNNKRELMTWDFERAFPVKWEGPTFNASDNKIAVETLVLTHEGLKFKINKIEK